jgi:RNA polymerase sigma-70 factor (ECF subfamily)
MENRSEQFTRLLEPEYKRANLFCRKLAGSSERGDDLFQEALIAAYKRLGSLKDENAFKPWLYRIIVNRFHSENRSGWFKRSVPLLPEMEEGLIGDSPAEQLDARRLIDEGLKGLTSDAQALVTLYELEGWSIEELARMLGRSQSWVKVNLYRARQKMRAQIEKKMKNR